MTEENREEFAQKVVLALIEKGCFDLSNLKAYSEFLRRRNAGELPKKGSYWQENILAESGWQMAATLDANRILAVYNALKAESRDIKDLMSDAKTFNSCLRELGIFST